MTETGNYAIGLKLFYTKVHYYGSVFRIFNLVMSQDSLMSYSRIRKNSQDSPLLWQ